MKELCISRNRPYWFEHFERSVSQRSSSTLICLPPLQGCCPGQGDRLSAVPGKTAYFRKCWWVSCNLQPVTWNKQVTAQKRLDETCVRRMINHLTFSYFLLYTLSFNLSASRSLSQSHIVLFTFPHIFTQHPRCLLHPFDLSHTDTVYLYLVWGEGEFCHDTTKKNK